ncbi:MAG: hypothetical protein R3344_00950 [Acidobacteriota bacterium]|nr:hypothetical protein [Acidobacteriota bacterium]
MRRPFILLILGVLTSCAPPSIEEEPRTGPYLGEDLPGAEARLFAPGFVSTGLSERDVTMTPDGSELYFSAQVGERGNFTAIVFTRQVDGVWTRPEVAPFSGQYLDIEPHVSPDGSKLFFASNRGGNMDIWVVDRVGDGWGAPRNIGPPVNTEGDEFFPSVTRDGTIYYTGPDENGAEVIYRARPAGDGEGYAKPEQLPEQVNSGQLRFNAFVSPDESFLIVPMYGREDSLGGVDYYVVFRSDDDIWTEPISLGAAVNSATGNEWSASLSPDGKVLFFMASRSEIEDHRAPAPMGYAAMRELHDSPMNGNSDIWWIDAGVIDALRP